MWDDIKDLLDRENEFDDDQELMKELYPDYDDNLDDDSEDDEF